MMIEARGLVRTFKTKRGPVQAVQGVDLEVADGEIVGFLGPNGAGKTTTMRMLATLIQPTAGTATVAGCDLAKDPVGVRRRIGYVPQSGSTLPEAIAGDEVVDHARLYGVPKAKAIAEGQRLFEELDLPGLWRRQCKTLSGGQRRRLDIVMGLIHDPKLIFLDEPTTGLDPQARANLWEHIRGLRDRGATIFLTTHYLDEADALCDRILVIDHGKIVASGTPENLKQQVSGDAVRLTIADTAQAPAVMKIVRELEGAVEVGTEDDVVGFRIPRGGSVLPTLLRSIDAQGIELHGVEVHRPTLDDVFLTMTGRSLRDEDANPTEEKKEAAA
ncbi:MULTISPECIES: ATP-binding cassette domain-containing protein [Kribbella]|uniref:ABC-2 type transport system ATP-binding protein n=1 Tax=Kribbella pratensis TaxID=2512112 RepID=A0ABY2FBY1_9ACTN|nr:MULTISPECIES: ATP-binding cassette domain-containing protein [Kribbella]TDW88096.1 ABC-2 type transport system ATP-binding protein [Kribbella pratensis]TDW88690.1 ABC-2 type transport system ATP-binding protein [Kribbella sp. VKM Ac-2566]